MTLEDKNLLRKKETFTRDEFLDMLKVGFIVNLKKFKVDWNEEEFSIEDTDIDYLKLSYFDKNFFSFNSNIRDIFIKTWSGGWEHRQNWIKIEWTNTTLSYNIDICLIEDKNRIVNRIVNNYKSKNKEEMVGYLLTFLAHIDPIKCIPLKRDYHLSFIC